MLKIAVSSLAGGQGKTTVSLFLAKVAAQQGYTVLAIDGDPQGNLSNWLGVFPGQSEPTLLEMIREQVRPEDAIYKIEGQENLFLIPADRTLNSAHEYLAGSGYAAFVLKQRLESLKNDVDICIIDSPPQRSQLCLTIMGAAEHVIVPAEANLKGVTSLNETIGLINAQSKYGAQAKLFGFIPFRDKWVGLTQTKESKESIFDMAEIAGMDNLLPSIRESEKIKRSINYQCLPDDEGLMYPFRVVMEKLQPLIKKGIAV